MSKWAQISRWCSRKDSVCQCRRHKRRGFNPWVGKIPGEGSGNLLQGSWLENSMDRGQWASVHGVAKSQTWLSKPYWHREGPRRMINNSRGWRFGDDFLLLYVFIYVFIIRKIFLFSNIYSGNVITWLLLGSLQTAVEPVHCRFWRCHSHRLQRKGCPLELYYGEALSSPILCSALSSYFNIYLESTISNIVAHTTEIAKSRQKFLPLQGLHSSEGGRQ